MAVKKYIPLTAAGKQKVKDFESVRARMKRARHAGSFSEMYRPMQVTKSQGGGINWYVIAFALVILYIYAQSN